MKLIRLSMVAIAALTAASTFAATPLIGVASALGSFAVNSAQVTGNSNIYEGSQISTNKNTSQIFLQNGPSVMLATNSGATVYNDHLVLTQGTVRVDNLSKFDVNALGYRIAADGPGAQAAVRLNEGTVEVASISGAVKVFDQGGAMLTRVGAGTASSFKQGGQQTGAGGGAAGGGGAAAGAVSGTNLLLYTAIIVGVAGVGLSTAAIVQNQLESTSP